MKFLTLLLLFVTSVAFGATAQVNSVVSTGAGSGANPKVPSKTFPLDDAARHITLSFSSDGTAATSFHGAYQLGGLGAPAGQYQVPAGKVTYCTAANVNSSGAGAFTFGYSTASFAENVIVAPAGAVYYGPGTLTAGANAPTISLFTGTLGVYDSVPLVVAWDSAAAANVYPFIQMNAGTPNLYMYLDCFEK